MCRSSVGSADSKEAKHGQFLGVAGTALGCWPAAAVSRRRQTDSGCRREQGHKDNPLAGDMVMRSLDLGFVALLGEQADGIARFLKRKRNSQ